MDSDQGKLFIGGISWETDEQKLKDYFGAYGDVSQTVVMRDKITGKPRGFGFVVFSDPDVLDTVLQDSHVIDGRTVEAKKALSREEQHVSKTGNPNSGRSFLGGGNTRTKKIFVGGLPPSLTEDGFRNYFEAYGSVTDVVIMYDQQTNRPRGFGFISFDSEDAVDRVLHQTFHDLDGKQVEVKRALPKDANPGATGRSMGGGGGSYQGLGQSGGNPYDGRMESSRYMQSQNTSSGYPPYSASGYNNPYGYAPNNGMGFGGYGSYGGASAGYGGPGGGYGNPNVANAGYGSNQGGAARSSWGSQTASGYGANMGYGNAPWGAANASAGSTGRAGGTGHSPSAAGYGNQGYGFGGYGTNEGMYGNQAGYGAVGGRQGSGPNGNSSVGGGAAGDLQAGGGGYMGGGYGDSSGNAGYGTQGWRSEQSQASGTYGQANYGGGYDGTQAQQQ
ncbi:hypothetical protein LIER_04292 [Lithospermum erythrorhizon]|uniref:RRM domain-containing protein n=1 Tax=Lithospermum erythrorhizon TaxID=34254 RepID=A0AAV3NWE7_LITER